jgi:hypothetical protein
MREMMLVNPTLMAAVRRLPQHHNLTGHTTGEVGASVGNVSEVASAVIVISERLSWKF